MKQIFIHTPLAIKTQNTEISSQVAVSCQTHMIQDIRTLLFFPFYVF